VSVILSILTHPSADDLNALYVYETKMSLLMQVSQTRQGAERLLESRVITILSQCDYLDARPEADQMFVGMWNQYLSHCPSTDRFVQIRVVSSRPPFKDIISYSCQLSNS